MSITKRIFVARLVNAEIAFFAFIISSNSVIDTANQILKNINVFSLTDEKNNNLEKLC